MINTYHTSVAPPPVPPRLHSSHQGQASQPVLIPAPVLAHGPSRSFMRFLMAIVLLNMVMSVAGIIYVYMNGRRVQQEINSSFQKTDPVFSMQKQHSNHITEKASQVFARMVFQRPSTKYRPQSQYLQWNIKYSRYSHPHINYYNNNWLTIEESGDYFVYSRLTFSKDRPLILLTNRVKLRKTKTDKDKVIMQAFCDMNTNGNKTKLCTAVTEDMLKLEKGNQLSVWTEDPSLVDYDETGSAFGLYRLL